MKNRGKLRRKRALSAAIAVTFAFGMAGCSGNEKSEATPVPFGSGAPTMPASSSSPTTTAPTTSAPPTSAPKAQRPKLEKPEYPEAARENSDAGIKAAVDFFFDAYRYGLVTGDDVPIKYASIMPCGICEALQADIKRGNDKGQWALLHEYKIAIPNIERQKKRDTLALLSVEITVPKKVTYNSAGEYVDEVAGEVARRRMVVDFVEGRWQIAGLGE